MRTEQPRRDRGYGMVELAVVVVLVAILAAIAAAALLGQRGRANDSAARSDAQRLGVRVSAWYAEHPGGGLLSVTTTGGHYVVDGEDAGPVSPGVHLGTHAASPTSTLVADTSGWTATTWCLNLLHPGGSQVVESVSDDGVRAGACP